MSPCLATYTYDFDNWHWEYRLYLDRLESEGHRGLELAIQNYELCQYSEFPNRTSYWVPTNRPALAILAAILVGAACVVGVIWLAIALPGIQEGIKAFLVLGGLLTLGAYKGILKATARKDWVTRADFRRVDGTEIFAVWEINNTQMIEFDTFMQKVQAVIQRSRPEPTGTSE